MLANFSFVKITIHELVRVVSLAVPGALMTLSEWFAFEILTFSVSYRHV
jgi:Na+-driven multidrug efflux pump